MASLEAPGQPDRLLHARPIGGERRGPGTGAEPDDRHAIVVFLQSVPPKPFAGKE